MIYIILYAITSTIMIALQSNYIFTKGSATVHDLLMSMVGIVLSPLIILAAIGLGICKLIDPYINITLWKKK